MADLSKIKLNGTEYTLKDAEARQMVSDLEDSIPEVPSVLSELVNDVGYITSYTETDPTVPAWAKTESKPTYTASEVGAAAASDLDNYVLKSGFNQTQNFSIGHSNTGSRPGYIGFSQYVDTETSGARNYTTITIKATQLSTNGGVKIYNIVTPTSDDMAANKKYVDDSIATIDQLKTTASSDNTEYNLIGTETSNANTAGVSIYKQDLLSFAKTASLGRLTIGSTSMPGILRVYTSADSASGFTDIKSNASSTNERTVTLPDASGTVALTSDLNNYVIRSNSSNSNSSYITHDAGHITIKADTSRLQNNSKIDLNGSTLALKSWSGISLEAENSANVIALTPTTTTIKNVVTPIENGDAVNKEYVDGLVSGMLHYKGTKATVSALPGSGNMTGDVWHITADGSEWAWDGSSWQELGTTVDLSGYVPSSRTVNGKALTANISLSASDVSALPASTTYVSTFNGQSGAITYTPPVTSVNEQTGAVTITASSISAAPATHAHGNITSGGDMTTTAAITSGDRLVINDESASKLTSSTITFGSSTTQYLANNGTWQNIPATYDDTALAARVTALEQIPWVTYYTGSSTPSNSQGNNGDLYFQTAQ